MTQTACAAVARPESSRRRPCLASVAAALMLNVAMFLNIFVLQA